MRESVSPSRPDTIVTSLFATLRRHLRLTRQRFVLLEFCPPTPESPHAYALDPPVARLHEKGDSGFWALDEARLRDCSLGC